MGLVPAAFAAGPLDMSTPYPSVIADPGTTVKFPVTVTTAVPQRVDLSVTGQPQGWNTRLAGGGSTIAAVTTVPASAATSGGTSASPAPVASGNYATFTAEVAVPAAAVAGTNEIVLQGKAADGTTTQLTVDVTVQTGSVGDVTMTTNFPTLTGSTSTSFQFSLTLNNNTNQQITFALQTDAPSGWTVTANPSGEANAASAVVDAGSSSQISVTAKAPADAAAGTYNLTVRAVGGPQPAETPLTVNLTGTYSMTLATSDGRLNANVTTGSSSLLNLVVTNSGSTDLEGVALTATPPQGWKVTFNPPTVNVPAGQTQTVAASITPANNALAGDYLLTVDAKAPNNTASDSVQIRTTVDTSPIGYVIGIAILVIVGIGLFFVFQRYGRR
jgi:uncharacterized membrane protein